MIKTDSRMKTQYRPCFIITLFFFFLNGLGGQPVLIDESVQAGELICFPVYGDSLQYKYLPSRGRLALSPEGLPEFSFLQYAIENKNTASDGRAINEAGGGGLVHFLVLYDTPEDHIRQAERELRRKMDKREAYLSGPVIFNKGNYLLVSSILRDGEEEKRLLTTGEAPVFENSKVAFSFLLSPEEAQLLMESFKMATPDISVMFDMEFSGLTQAYQGELVVDWSLVEQTAFSSRSVDAIFYSSDVEKTFGSLVQNGAIQLTSAGNDTLSEQLMQIAYDKLLDIMFEPQRPEMLPKEKTTGFLEDVFGRRGLLGGLFGGSNVYKKRTIKTSGKTVIKLNSRFNVRRNHLITFNIGGLHKEHGEDLRIFRRVAFDDPTYLQREVMVSLDGSLTEEFEKMVNTVSVVLKKAHNDGSETIKEVFLSQEVLKNFEGDLTMGYLNRKDNDRLKWLDYKYKVDWQFKKDGGYTSAWMPSNSPVINLYTPYKYRGIIVDGDQEILREKGVRRVSVQLKYPFFGKEKKETYSFKVEDIGVDNEISAVIPEDVEEIDYVVYLNLKDGTVIKNAGKDTFGFILVDEML